MTTLEFYDPSGTIEVTQPHAQRVASLEGKRIGIVSNHHWQAHRMLPMLKAMIEADFPSAEVLAVDAFPQGNAVIGNEETDDRGRRRAEDGGARLEQGRRARVPLGKLENPAGAIGARRRAFVDRDRSESAHPREHRARPVAAHDQTREHRDRGGGRSPSDPQPVAAGVLAQRERARDARAGDVRCACSPRQRRS